MNKNDNSPLVSICCLVYNHENFLRQCLDGFLIQKIDFPIEILIHDDASTDRSADIIREYEEKYPEIIKPIYQKENQYSKGVKVSATFQYPRAKGKYIALCEGDDYWTDPYKLQKQVDFLETHPDYGMVHTKTDVYFQKEDKLLKGVYGGEFKSFDELLIQNRISTLTVCFRTELIKSYYKDIELDSSWLMGDYPLWLYIAMKSKIHRLNQSTAVYRILEESASHSGNFQKQIQFIFSIYSIKYYFMIKTHKEYLHIDIAQNIMRLLLKYHIEYHRKMDFKLYKKKLKIKSIGIKFTCVSYLKMMKHRILF